MDFCSGLVRLLRSDEDGNQDGALAKLGLVSGFPWCPWWGVNGVVGFVRFRVFAGLGLRSILFLFCRRVSRSISLVFVPAVFLAVLPCEMVWGFMVLSWWRCKAPGGAPVLPNLLSGLWDWFGYGFSWHLGVFRGDVGNGSMICLVWGGEGAGGSDGFLVGIGLVECQGWIAGLDSMA